ncbi:MAG TPA: LCP family protein [Symbiobacteriaceae bacterium]|nr:LCP family protein [Symbiobacteriaceae bacterium]
MKRRWLLGCAIAALLVSVAAMAGAWWFLRRAVPLPEVRVQPQQLVNLVTRQPTGPMNVLVLGVDEEKLRTDVIILARWDPAGRRLNLVSLPRDSLVEITCPAENRACLSPDKLGHAHAYGEVVGRGPAVVTATVEQFLGVQVDHYVRLDFEGFAHVIDALGGITLNVADDMPKIGLKAGAQLLDGQKALAYVRDRSDGQGDIGRIERTELFLKALAERVGEGSVDDPSLLKEALPHVATDLDVGTLLALARDWRELRHDLTMNVAFLPGRPDTYRGLWVWRVDEAGKAKLVQQYLTE